MNAGVSLSVPLFWEYYWLKMDSNHESGFINHFDNLTLDRMYMTVKELTFKLYEAVVRKYKDAEDTGDLEVISELEAAGNFLNDRKKSRSAEDMSIGIYDTLKPTFSDVLVSFKQDSFRRSELHDVAKLALETKYPNKRYIEHGPLIADVVSAAEKIERQDFVVDSYRSLRELLPRRNFVVKYALLNGTKIAWDTPSGEDLFSNSLWNDEPQIRSLQVRRHIFRTATLEILAKIPRSKMDLCPHVFVPFIDKKRKGQETKKWRKFELRPDHGLTSIAVKKDVPPWIGKEDEVRNSENNENLMIYDILNKPTTPKKSGLLDMIDEDTIDASCKCVYYYATLDRSLKDVRTTNSRRAVSPVQVYCGKASAGLLRRWLTSTKSHTANALKLLNHIAHLKERDAPEYEQMEGDETIQLVDAYMALNWLNAAIEKKDMAIYHALFIMDMDRAKNVDETLFEKLEYQVIRDHQLTDMRFGLNMRMPKPDDGGTMVRSGDVNRRPSVLSNLSKRPSVQTATPLTGMSRGKAEYSPRTPREVSVSVDNSIDLEGPEY